MTTHNRSVSRSLEILRLFNSHPTPTLGEVSAAVSLPKPTTLRFLRTLEGEGYVTRSPTSKRYRLTPAVLELGFAALRSLGISGATTPFMDELAAATGGVVNLSVLDEHDILYLARVSPPPEIRRLVTMRISVGSRIPAYCTAMGRMLLAGNPSALESVLTSPIAPMTPKSNTDPDSLRRAVERAGENGFCVSEEELALGFIGIAVPVPSSELEQLALGLTVTTTDYNKQQIVDQLVPSLFATAAKISRGLSQPLGG